MTASLISRIDQVCWQHRAARHLAAVLRAHPDLPPIDWIIGAGGCTLTGRVNGLVPGASARATFEAWQHALCLAETPGCGRYRTAAGTRERVRVILTATIDDHEDEEVVPR